MSREDMLARVPLFSEVSQRDLRGLAKVMVSRTYGRGDVILKEGDDAVGMFIVASGRVEVVKGLNTNKPQPLATLGPGDFFGEMSLLDKYPRSASVRALDDTECLAFTRWDFLAELRTQPSVALQMLGVMARRLRETDARLVE
ncbi:MAG: cyclic nucleotide-binding domain-containing protein [Dehalococcoidia bacterium]